MNLFHRRNKEKLVVLALIVGVLGGIAYLAATGAEIDDGGFWQGYLMRVR